MDTRRLTISSMSSPRRGKQLPLIGLISDDRTAFKVTHWNRTAFWCLLVAYWGGLARLMAKLTWDGQVLTAVIRLIRLQDGLETHHRQSNLIEGWGLSVTSAENEPRRISLAGPLVSGQHASL